MKFNQYSLYSLNTQDRVQDSKSKIHDDINRMNNMSEYYDILDFIENNYGQVENHLEKDFPENVKLFIDLETNVTQVVVVQENKMLFGKRWVFTPDEVQA